MSTSKIEAPKMPKVLPSISLPDERMDSEDSFHTGIISDCTIDNQKASKVAFDKIIFEMSRSRELQ